MDIHMFRFELKEFLNKVYTVAVYMDEYENGKSPKQVHNIRLGKNIQSLNAEQEEHHQAFRERKHNQEGKNEREKIKKHTKSERISGRKVTGVFSGSYAINPFTGDAVPIWISDYVLAGYGTGAIMAVPAHDSRDYAFAKHFNLPIVPLVEGCDVSEESFDAKEGIVCNSPKVGATPYCDLNLNGLTIKEAIATTKKYVKELN